MNNVIGGALGGAPNPNNMTEEERRTLIMATKELRRRMERHGQHIGTADGTNKDSLKEWVDSIDRAIRYCQATDALTIELVGTLASGPLARVIATYLDTQPVGQQTWAGVKAEISRNYLNEEEKYQMRQKVEQMYQKPYEDVQTYGRNFKMAVARCYSDAELAQQMAQENLIKIFISGLRDEKVRHDVFAQRPVALDAAVTSAGVAAHTVAVAGNPSRAETRNIEPMDVNAMPLPSKSSGPSSEKMDQLLQEVRSVQGQVKVLLSSLPAQQVLPATHNIFPASQPAPQYSQNPSSLQAVHSVGGTGFGSVSYPQQQGWNSQNIQSNENGNRRKKRNYPNQNSSQSTNQKYQNNDRNRTSHCWTCGKEGHFARECQNKPITEAQLDKCLEKVQSDIASKVVASIHAQSRSSQPVYGLAHPTYNTLFQEGSAQQTRPGAAQSVYQGYQTSADPLAGPSPQAGVNSGQYIEPRGHLAGLASNPQNQGN